MHTIKVLNKTTSIFHIKNFIDKRNLFIFYFIDMTIINILTRTGNREKYFTLLKNSVLEQTYIKNIKHLKSNDNLNCSYLKNEIDVFPVNTIKKTRNNAFYNLYLNELLNEVNEGWIIILDDDSKLIDNTFIEKLASVCEKANNKDVLIYQSKIVSTVLPYKRQMLDKKIIIGDIDMACFCFHYSLYNEIKFDERRCGDYNFLKKIQDAQKFNLRYINLPVGIWANYDGAKLGKN